MQRTDDVLSCLKGLNEMKNVNLQWCSLHNTAVLLTTPNFWCVKCWSVGCSWYCEGLLCLQNANYYSLTDKVSLPRSSESLVLTNLLRTVQRGSQYDSTLHMESP